MLQFHKIKQKYPTKRNAETRRQDFAEIYRGYGEKKAQEQALRCSQCGIPFCQIHCPLHNNIPDWLKLTAQGRLREAYDMSAMTNPLPEICGRICPQDRLCEGNCVVHKNFSAVTIGSIEKYLSDTAWEKGWVAPIQPVQDLDQSVGIVGSGPAGLAAAEKLCQIGYRVTVYEKSDRAGGLLIYGIPNFKLDKAIVSRRIERLEKAGIVFHLNCTVGEDLPYEELRQKHDAILLCVGAREARRLGDMNGAELALDAMDYLTASDRCHLGDSLPKKDKARLDASGRDVLVIGGGDTAMDCVRTALRQGANSVRCVYRRDRSNMPGSANEVAHAEEEGAEFLWLAAPVNLAKKGQKINVTFQEYRLANYDETGRRMIKEKPGVDFTCKADMVIAALGFIPEDLPDIWNIPDLNCDRRRPSLKPDCLETSLDGVFAAGDFARGASLVVWAIRDGMQAAEEIDAKLKISGLKTSGKED